MNGMFLGVGLEKYANLGLVLKYIVFYLQRYIANLLYKILLGNFSLYFI